MQSGQHGEVLLVVNKETGEMESHIDGVIGPACDDISKMIEKLTGQATETTFTPEYYQRAAQAARVKI
jgi:hypothetical protein